MQASQSFNYPTPTSSISWEDDFGDALLNDLLAQDPYQYIQHSSPSHSDPPKDSTLTGVPNPKFFQYLVSLRYFSSEDLKGFSAEYLRRLQKKCIKFVSAFSVLSPYIAEGYRQRPLGEVLKNIKYCRNFDAASFMFKRIRNKSFLKMRKPALHFIKSVAKLTRFQSSQDKSLVVTNTIKSLTQSIPDNLIIQKGLKSLSLNSIFPEKQGYGKKITNFKLSKKRVIDKILCLRDLKSLSLRRETISNILQNKEEIQRLIENLPNLREFMIGVNLGFRTLWNPKLSENIAARITHFVMHYQSSHSDAQEPKPPIFDFLDNIDGFKNLTSFRYEELDGVHWNFPEILAELPKLERFQRISLEKFYINLFFGFCKRSPEQLFEGFFRYWKLPSSLRDLVFNIRVNNLILFHQMQETRACFKNLELLQNLRSFELNVITNSLAINVEDTKEQPQFLINLFQETINYLSTTLEDLSLAVIKTFRSYSQGSFQDQSLLTTIADRFKQLKSLSIELSGEIVALAIEDINNVLPNLKALTIIGCSLPYDFCGRLNSVVFEKLIYHAPKGIDLPNIIECLEHVSNLVFLKHLTVSFDGCDKFDLRREIVECVVKIVQRLTKLTEFIFRLDVRVKQNTLKWLLSLVNFKKNIKYCKLNFYQYGVLMPCLIGKEDAWIKDYIERARKFLIK